MKVAVADAYETDLASVERKKIEASKKKELEFS